jgi:uncharacterized membrane-anchored protein YhcB (DUF1043 family)
MTFLWIQLALDGAIIGIFLVWIAQRKGVMGMGNSDEKANEMDAWQEKLRQMENEMQRYREKMDAQLNALKKICDEAARILSRTSNEIALDPSFEENEIKSALQTSSDQIPTLHQLEKTRGRLESELKMDLRSLLRDQLV